MRLRRLFAALILLATPAIAHELGVMQVDAIFKKDGTYSVDLLVDLEHLPPQTSVRDIADSARLSFDEKLAKPAKSEITKNIDAWPRARVRLSGRTPFGVSCFTFADDAISGYFVLKLQSEGREGTVTQWVEGGKSSAPFPLDRAVVPLSRSKIVRLYLVLGFTHILPRGLDHVLFVLGIFLLAVKLRPMLWQVSAFTVAHTITLALTIYGVVSLPSRVVEPLIALSIVYVAVENVFTAKLHAWRPVVVFCFGLLHGMVVREDVEVLADDHRVRVAGSHDSGDGHGLGAAGELPEQLVAAAQPIGGARSGFGGEGVPELDAIDRFVLEARSSPDVELVAVSVARAEALVALTRLVERVEVHDQVELVVRAVGHPGVGVGVVGARLVEDCQRLAVARRVSLRDKNGNRSK